MRVRPINPHARWFPAAVVSLLLLGASVPAGVEAEAAAKKDLRVARAAVREGRLEEALEAYESALELGLTDKQRFEALYGSVLTAVSSGSEGAASSLVRERLQSLRESTGAEGRERALEIRSLDSLAGINHSLETRVFELEARLAAETEAAARASAEQSRVAEEALAEQRALERAARNEQVRLRQRIEQLKGHLETRESELEARVEELGRCASEMRFVVDQLEGTQESELQMLQVVVRKNEDLSKARLALRKREKALVDQAEELELKEEEIRRREEAIRQVTERVLGADPP